jgi:hypothetical protein
MLLNFLGCTYVIVILTALKLHQTSMACNSISAFTHVHVIVLNSTLMMLKFLFCIYVIVILTALPLHQTFIACNSISTATHIHTYACSCNSIKQHAHVVKISGLHVCNSNTNCMTPPSNFHAM